MWRHAFTWTGVSRGDHSGCRLGASRSRWRGTPRSCGVGRRHETVCISSMACGVATGMNPLTDNELANLPRETHFSAADVGAEDMQRRVALRRKPHVLATETPCEL